MKRSFEEIVAALFAELSHPAGAVLLTGTGVVPPDEVTLRDGDEVRIAIDGVGVLRHDIYQQTAGAHVQDAHH
jgi:2-dehydro-3-deoxy-D-arabinonate dehydratase